MRPEPARPVGYIELVRGNAAFRRLWYGQIVSQMGDWFDNIALYTLVLRLTGSGQALGLLLVAEFLPPTLVSPLAGIFIDRLPRKLVMVAADVLRALLVPLVLLVNDASDIWIIYVVMVLKFSLVGIFEPARSALLPNVVSREELVAANALSGITWSAVLALGAALGGFVAGQFGFQTAIILDSVTFWVSAWLIAGVAVRETHHQHPPDHDTPQASPGRARDELQEGLRFIAGRLDLFLLTFAKAFWNISGGVLVLFSLYGRQIFPLGEEGAISIGLFYAARGVGAGIGPILARRLFGESPPAMRRMVGLAYILSTAGYLVFGGTPWFALALLAVMLAHMGGSINWVFSTALLQIQVPDALRGRVFAIEFAALMFTTALSSYLTGAANDAGWTPRMLSVVLALLFVFPGVLLTVLLWRVPSDTGAPPPEVEPSHED